MVHCKVQQLYWLLSFYQVHVKIQKITKLYFVLGSDSNPESKTLIIISRLYLSLYTWLASLSINPRPTSSSILLWISDHYTLANIKLLNMVVSLLGTGFYILLLIMVFTMFHIFLVFKSCTCNVLVQFWYQLCFITLYPLPEISLSCSNSFSAPPVLKLGQQKGWAAQHTCWG